MKILHVVGARPNFVKLAPVYLAITEGPGWEQIIVHTGQHYDREMSDVFFEEFGLPNPDVNLQVGSLSHGAQIGAIMSRLDPMLGNLAPDWVIVYGDVNSTLAAALAAEKRGIRVAHVEAGLRSFDRTMPEEINRVLTDHLADLLFTSCQQDARDNLEREGIKGDRVRFVGNVMIDTLVRMLPRIRERRVALGRLGYQYAVATFHRPSNVDDPANLQVIMATLQALALQGLPVFFIAHPRTAKRLDACGLRSTDSVGILPPQSYMDFLVLMNGASVVLTDSGGVQEETSGLGIPCVTVRPNTERPITIIKGTNRLVRKVTVEAITKAVWEQEAVGRRVIAIDGWDGHAAERVVAALEDLGSGIGRLRGDP